jgi:membrane-associated phospholipid phosphatase
MASPNPAAGLPTGDNNSQDQSRRFHQNLFEGAKASLGTWNIALLVTSFFLEHQNPRQKIMTLPPLEIDAEISEQLARNDGRASLGALRPSLYPSLAATSRLAGMIVLDAVGGQDYSPTSYTKLFRFHQALYCTKVVTRLAKRNIHRYRPDRSDTQSFFSGHTSTVFATSTFFYLEVNDFIDAQARRHDQRLPLLSPCGWKILSAGVLYGWAGYVGFSRIYDKKHYLSDVLAGAASGTLVSYLFYPRGEKDTQSTKIQMGIQPMDGGAVLGLNFEF